MKGYIKWILLIYSFGYSNISFSQIIDSSYYKFIKDSILISYLSSSYKHKNGVSVFYLDSTSTQSFNLKFSQNIILLPLNSHFNYSIKKRHARHKLHRIDKIDSNKIYTSYESFTRGKRNRVFRYQGGLRVVITLTNDSIFLHTNQSKGNLLAAYPRSR